MVKIFPVRIVLTDVSVEDSRIWQWMNDKIAGSQVTQIVPLNMEQTSSKTKVTLKGLVEVHCNGNITTSELANLLRPYPDFVQDIHLSFQ